MTTAAEFMSAAPARLEGNTPWAALTLPSGHVALFDEADRALVEQFKWHAKPARHTFYAQTHGGPANGKVRTYLHRLILGAVPGQQVDHRNQNGLDNRRCNLRICTPGQNNANHQGRVDASSGYRGVSLHSNNGTNPWRARIQTGSTFRHLGYFADPWEAALAYNVVALEIYGEFAFLNEKMP